MDEDIREWLHDCTSPTNQHALVPLVLSSAIEFPRSRFDLIFHMDKNASAQVLRLRVFSREASFVPTTAPVVVAYTSPHEQANSDYWQPAPLEEVEEEDD
eukprot:m51a1_g14371 hypothetical protein (100) ;mRNA; f:254616-254963